MTKYSIQIEKLDFFTKQDIKQVKMYGYVKKARFHTHYVS